MKKPIVRTTETRKQQIERIQALLIHGGFKIVNKPLWEGEHE